LYVIAAAITTPTEEVTLFIVSFALGASLPYRDA
jgi:hypothetical protein